MIAEFLGLLGCVIGASLLVFDHGCAWYVSGGV